MTKIINKTISVTLLICIQILFGCSHKISVESLLQEMPDRTQLTYFPEIKYKLKQASSYNRETVTPEENSWFANYDMSHFIRVEQNNNHREFVMFDQEGPGAIVRWWMTFWRAEDGIVRIYIDNDTIPEVEGPPFEVISGQMLAPKPFSDAVPEEAPLNERGHNLYVPIPYSEHCKVTYECDSLVKKDNRYFPDVFYNICYREYEDKTKVKSFSKETLAKSQFDNANLKLSKPTINPKISKEFNQQILPNDSLVLIFNETNLAVYGLSLKIESENIEQALRSVVLAASFDGQQTIWSPIGDFFGTGYQMFPHSTFMNSTLSNNQMYSNWVMPYKENCRLAYINYGNDTVNITGEIGLSDYKWEKNSMYFCSTWHEYYHIKTRGENYYFFDINYVDIEGKGLYVGDQVTLFNMAQTWWGEGDEKIFVDGEKFPSSIGTGSEDYYGYAFGHPEPFSHPFISQPTGAGNFVPGMTVNMRHRSLDAIPFYKSLSANIELWHWASTCMNYALTSYFYVQPPYKINIKPNIESVKRQEATSAENFHSEYDENSCRTIEEWRHN